MKVDGFVHEFKYDARVQLVSNPVAVFHELLSIPEVRGKGALHAPTALVARPAVSYF